MTVLQKTNRRDFLLGVSAITLSGCKPEVKAPSQTHDADVIVIGAGLSGLNAALLLEETGHKVIVLEGRDRIGGRVYTLNDVPGNPESGGNEIGSTYGRVLDIMDKYNVLPVTMRPRTEAITDHTCLHIQGQTIRLKDWAAHAENPFPKAHRETLPWHLEYKVFGKANPLTHTEQFLDPQYAHHDISIYDFLKAQGFSDPAIKLGAGTNMGQGNGPKDLSVLHWFNIMAFVQSSIGEGNNKPSVSAQGGNQRIPQAMASHLKSEVRRNHKVIGIRSEANHAEIQLEGGTKLTAKRVIVTLPFAALRHVNVEAPLTPQQRQAIAEVDYTRVTQLHYRPTQKFWEQDDLPPSMWTDSQSARFLALRNDPHNRDKITSFVVYTNDRVAQKFDQLGAKAANQSVLAHLAMIRPSTKGALEFVKFLSWQNDSFAGGAYAAWKPGQVTAFGQGVAMPAGRLHFAGAHTSIVTRGMEAAMESGERAAFEVLETI